MGSNCWRVVKERRSEDAYLSMAQEDGHAPNGYPRYRVQKWDEDVLIVVKTFDGETGEMDAERMFTDLLLALVYS